MSNQEDLLVGTKHSDQFPTSINEDLDGLFASSNPGERKASLANSESTHSISSVEHNSTNHQKSMESENDQKFKFSNILSHSVVDSQSLKRSLIEVEKVHQALGG